MQKIRTVREEAGISVGALSARLGKKNCTIYHYERGRRKPDINLCWDIVHSLQELGADCGFEDVFPDPRRSEDEVLHGHSYGVSTVN